MPRLAKANKKILLVGGGHTHALVLQALKTAPLKGVDLTVVNPGISAPYSGMLPGFIAGHYTRSELDIDLQTLTDSVGAKLVDSKANGLNLVERSVLLENGEALPFDYASIDVGITSQMANLKGFSEHGVPAKPLAGIASRWDAFRARKGPKNVVIIGGGIAGAEIAMAMAFALRNDDDNVSVKLLDRSQILSGNSPTAQRLVRKELTRNSVSVVEGSNVVAVTESSVVLNDQGEFPADFVVGAAGATPHEWLRDIGLDSTDGFINVDESLQTSLPGNFAVGDCAHMVANPRPKAGVFAVRQAPILTENLRRMISGNEMQNYRPQSDYLKLVSLGGKRAFGEKYGWAFSGHLLWRLKDKIDRDFMNQF